MSRSQFILKIPEATRILYGQPSFDHVTEQNRLFIAKLDDPTFDRSTQMDATRNCAAIYLQEVAEFIDAHGQAYVPRGIGNEMYDSSMALLSRLELDYPPAVMKPLRHAYNEFFLLWHGNNVMPIPEEHFPKRLFKAKDALLDAINDFNVYVATTPSDDEGKETPNSINAKLDSLLNKLDAKPDKEDFLRAKRKILQAIEGVDEQQSKKQGPISKVRLDQVNAVKHLLHVAVLDHRTMSLNDACLEVWEPLTGGYPTPKSLYQYCHAHRSEFITNN